MTVLKGFIYVLFVGSLTSCITLHSGTISSTQTGPDVVFKDVAYGVSQLNKPFYFGGNSSDAMVYQAKQEMVKQHQLEEGEEYANFTIDSKNTIWPLFAQKKVTVSADVVAHFNSEKHMRYSETYRRKMLGQVTKDGFFEVGDTVVDRKCRKYVVASFKGGDRARVLRMNQKGGRFKTQLIALDKIFQVKGRVSNIEVGHYFSYFSSTKNDESAHLGKVAGIGRESVLLLKDTKRERYQVIRKRE